MQIKVNNQPHQFSAEFPATLLSVLALLMPDLQTNGIAVAINSSVIPREDWPSTPIADQDEILIITATQGG
ncbi:MULTISPECIES: sulfur carrier protein ThiS [Sphingobacterium]|uniref:sulfur carrier protein ThiS n=1 Tax=Sphingobacterium TaxID=28453 RepID=UPI0013D972B4|nr:MULTISPECIES: sulfur carrier protein ThiS [unclassified Sphingobacterium]